MLSVSLIERTLETRDYDRLLRDLSDNGLSLPLSIRMRLGQSPAGPIALALRRLVELTYGPTALSRRLVDRLLCEQRFDGCSDPQIPAAGTERMASEDGGRDPLVVATVLAGLSRVAADHPATVGDELRSGLDRGYAALAELQDCDGLFSSPDDRSVGDRALTTAFIVSLLGADPRFRAGVRLGELHQWFEARDGRLDRQTQRLWDLALISIHDIVEPAVFAA
ncbi:MAG: hypothetical protein AAGH99_14245 [Planctomycetota bacterium]